MDQQTLDHLIRQYQNGSISTQDKALLEQWYLQLAKQHSPEISHTEITNRLDQTLIDLQASIKTSHRRSSINHQIIYWATAAAIACMIPVGYFFFRSSNQASHTIQTSQADIIRPGSNQATITLQNGKTIQLSQTQNTVAIHKETISDQNGNSIQNLTKDIIQLTASTPKGGTYNFTLPDGSLAILNADSKLIFPSNFSNKERKVQLQGEGYFQITKDPKRPFIVESAGQQVKVLGTRFNINAYHNEPNITTTLEEGSVALQPINHTTSIKIIPGQQATYRAGNFQVSKANLESALSWKDGYFRLKDENIESIMRKISRWYNIEVQYDGPVSKELMNGKISKYKNIDQVLDMLGSTKTVTFKVEGRRITVRSKP